MGVGAVGSGTGRHDQAKREGVVRSGAEGENAGNKIVDRSNRVEERTVVERISTRMRKIIKLQSIYFTEKSRRAHSTNSSLG